VHDEKVTPEEAVSVWFSKHLGQHVLPAEVQPIEITMVCYAKFAGDNAACMRVKGHAIMSLVTYEARRVWRLVR